MTTPSEGPPPDDRRQPAPARRFPLGITIAVLVAALLLVVLLLPRVLLYPAQPPAPETPDWAGQVQDLKDQNDKLAQQVAQLEALLSEDLCRLPDGGLQKLDGTPVQPPAGETPQPGGTAPGGTAPSGDVPVELPAKPKSP